MRKKTFIYFSFLAAMIVSFYLCLPSPVIPDLPGSLKSDEPGDTYQMSNIAAYFTDYERDEILAYYHRAFARSTLFNLPLPTVSYTLPVEDRHFWLGRLMQTTYFEENSHFLRESLFVNLWEPRPLVDDGIFIKGKQYKTKVTVRTVQSPIPVRLIVFGACVLTAYQLFKEWRRLLYGKNN